MANELIDIYDEKNEILLSKKMKSEAHEKGLWHRTIHVWIYNSKKEILLQLRSRVKALYPSMWDISVAGHVGAGEKETISALREIKEEISLNIEESDLELYKVRVRDAIFNDIIDKEFNYIYFLKYDKEIKNLNLQKEEVEKISFVPIEKIEEELRSNPEKYTPHGDYWFEMIEKIKEKVQ